MDSKGDNPLMKKTDEVSNAFQKINWENPREFITLINKLWCKGEAAARITNAAVSQVPSEVMVTLKQLESMITGLSLKALTQATDEGKVKSIGSGAEKKWRLVDALKVFVVDREPTRRKNKNSVELIQAIGNIAYSPDASNGSKAVIKKGGLTLPPPEHSGYVSPSKISGLVMPNQCDRCSKIQLHSKTPWDIFPGIFFSIDRYQKAVIRAYLDTTGSVPPWISPELGEATGYIEGLGYRNFRRKDEKTGLIVRGEPDDIYVMSGGTWSYLVDHKTAKLTDTQRTLGAKYRCQLDFYKWISEAFGNIPAVLKSALIYWEPSWSDDKDQLVAANVSGLAMPLLPTLVEVESDFEFNVRGVLDKAADLIETAAPKGRPGCKDCALFDDIAAWAS